MRELVSFYGMNDERLIILVLVLQPRGISYTETNVHDNNIHSQRIFTIIMTDQPNEVLIIVVEDQSSVFVNNQLIYSFLDRQGSVGL